MAPVVQPHYVDYYIEHLTMHYMFCIDKLTIKQIKLNI